jgi:hypothetical protein
VVDQLIILEASAPKFYHKTSIDLVSPPPQQFRRFGTNITLSHNSLLIS